MSEQKQTGYPSVDKPWLKYYPKEAIDAPIPDCTAYEYMRSGNAGHEKEIALNYCGRKITYGELFSCIDRATAAFAHAGIGQGDIVAGITPTMPEVIYSFYALNRLGAISDFFDPRSDADVIYLELVAAKVKAVIIFEDFIPKFSSIIQKAGIPLLVVVSAKDSLSFIPRVMLSLKGKKDHPANCLPYRNFIKLSQSVSPESSLENAACTMRIFWLRVPMYIIRGAI